MTDINQPVSPDIGPEGLPTPALPAEPVPSVPIIPIVPVRVCPAGTRQFVVQNGQTFTDLLIAHNVSYNALRAVNPTLSTTRIAPGTRYCVPPSGTRKFCQNGSETYAMGQYEDLNTMSELFSLTPAAFLAANPDLAPADFGPGQVVCVP